jgi:zinc/manganese transport system permease protein
MNDFITFMAAPALGCMVMSFIFTYFGVHVLKRGIVFIDLSMAQLAALGTTVAFALNLEEYSVETFLFSVGFVFVGALFFTLVRFMAPRVSQEAVIGIVYVVAASLAVIVADRSPRAAEHIQHTLNGSILWISWGGVLELLIAFIMLGGFLWATRKPFFECTDQVNLEAPYTKNRGFWDFAFYLTLGLAIVMCIQTAGIFLIFALLIIPAACAIQLNDSLAKQLYSGSLIGILVSWVGLGLSFGYDLPTGSTLVCAFGVTFVAILGLSFLQRKRGDTL